MKLLTKELEKVFEKYPFESQEKLGGNALVIAKYFNPIGNETWLITEAEKEDDGNYTLFGYVNLGDELTAEFGYISLNELESIKLPAGFTIERDLYLPENTTLINEMEKSGMRVPDFLIDEEEKENKIRYAGCYDTLYVFKNKNDLDRYFYQCYSLSEGAEQKRYAQILSEAQCDNKISLDGRNNLYNEISINVDGNNFINYNLDKKNTLNSAISIYENILKPIIKISENYYIDFTSKNSFSDFGNDSECENLNLYNFSTYYKDLAKEFNINIESIITDDVLGGGYECTINNQTLFDVSIKNNINDVVNNVGEIIEYCNTKEETVITQ